MTQSSDPWIPLNCPQLTCSPMIFIHLLKVTYVLWVWATTRNEMLKMSVDKQLKITCWCLEMIAFQSLFKGYKWMRIKSIDLSKYWRIGWCYNTLRRQASIASFISIEKQSCYLPLSAKQSINSACLPPSNIMHCFWLHSSIAIA
jgi:hypothetical protein